MRHAPFYCIPDFKKGERVPLRYYRMHYFARLPALVSVKQLQGAAILLLPVLCHVKNEGHPPALELVIVAE